MTFTKRFEKAIRRKKRSNRPGAEPISRMQVRHMTKRMANDHKVWASVVKLGHTSTKDMLFGVWVWREGDSDFLLAGEKHEHLTALDRIAQVAPEAKLITPQEFLTRTRHVRGAGEEN